jgi:gamma-glutamyltranspeptidase/glutathione hydrolase
LNGGPFGGELLMPDGKAPGAGQVFKNPGLANTFRSVAAKGRAGFYEGAIGEAIVSLLTSKGGAMTLDDLKSHVSTFDEPISVNYKGVTVHEIPPNGQGITALVALNILEGLNLESHTHGSVDHIHKLIEVMRLAFADTRYYVADPSKVHVPVRELLSKEYAKTRRQLYHDTKGILPCFRPSFS